MAPVPIEDDIKAELGEVVSQAMLVGIFFSKTCFDQLLDLKKCFYQLLDLKKCFYHLLDLKKMFFQLLNLKNVFINYWI